MAPQIREYTADSAVAGPVEARQLRQNESGGIGAAMQKFGSEVQDAGIQIQHAQAQREVSDLQAQLAKTHADLTDELGNAKENQDPQNKTMAEDFLQNVDDRFSDIGSKLETPQAKKYFEKATADLRGGYQVAAHKQQAMLAGQNAEDNHYGMLDATSNAVYNDPSSFEKSSALVEHSLDAQVELGTITQSHADQLQTEADTKLAVAAAKGLIRINPNAAKYLLEKDNRYDDYITSDQKDALISEADRGINAIEVGRKQALAEQKEALKEKQGKLMSGYLQKLIAGNGVSPKTVVNDPNLSYEQQENLVRWIDQRAKGEDKFTNEGFYDAFQRIHLPDGDPKKIVSQDQIDKLIGNTVSFEKGMQLRTELSGRKTDAGRDEMVLKNNFIKSVRDSLVKDNGMGLKDPEGMDNFNRFLPQFLDSFRKGRESGIPARDLLDPSNKNFVGDSKPYKKTPEQVLQTISRSYTRPSPSPSATPAAPGQAAAPGASAPVAPKKPVEPRRPGESPSDYLKRMKDGS